jgi:hypothetical protein
LVTFGLQPRLRAIDEAMPDDAILFIEGHWHAMSRIS